MRIFLDTNVWIDFLAERFPYYLSAASLFTCAEEGKCYVVISSLSMINAQYICCERGKMPLASWKQKVTTLKDLYDVCSVDSSDVFSSAEADWTDFEDCVQFYAAKRSGCDVIVTRNPKDFSQSDMVVMTPEEMLELLQQ